MSPNGGATAAPLGGQQLVSDGVGVAAPAMARPRRFTEGGEARADESMGLPRRSKAPLVVLLAVDAGLAVAGALLLRAGLAGPAVASAAPRAETRAPAVSAAEPAEPPANAAAKLGEGPAAASPPEPVAADAGKVTPPPPSAEERAAAPEPAAPPKGLAPGEPAPGKAPDQTVDQPTDKTTDQAVGNTTDRATDDVAAKKKKKDRRSSSAEGPVDPYAPAPDLSSQINKLFTKGQSKLDKCHASIARGQGPSQLTLSFRVMADGSLGGIRVLGAPAGAEMLGMCVTAELAKWKVQSGESGEFVRRIQFR